MLLGAGRRRAQLDAAARGTRQDFEGQHVLAEFRPFSEQEFPSTRRPSNPELLGADRSHLSLAGDATAVRRPHRTLHGPSHALRYHPSFAGCPRAREDLLRAAGLRCPWADWRAASRSSPGAAEESAGPRPWTWPAKAPTWRCNTAAGRTRPRRAARKCGGSDGRGARAQAGWRVPVATLPSPRRGSRRVGALAK